MIPGIRHALRSLRRSPAFALTVIATLGIGIGLNSAIFTVVDCVLLRPLGYRDADRIVSLQTHFVDENRSIAKLGGDDYSDLSRQIKGVESMAFYRDYGVGIQLGGEALYLPVASVSPGFGQVMGVQPVAGRIFQATDTIGHEALVSATFARDHFSSAQAALGQVIRYEGALRPIVGVLPDGFSFPGKTAVWIEENATPGIVSRTAYNQHGIAKRRAGVSSAQLNAELDAFSHRLQHDFPEDRHKTIEAVPLQEQIVGTIRPTLHLLMGSVAIVLLIVCANIMHLQLVRATRQLRAVTIRTALGASRASLTSGALLEVLLLATAGCIAAFLLEEPGLRLLVRIAPPDIPRLNDIHLNLDVLLFSFFVSLLVMSVAAILPIWRSWHIDPASTLRQDASRGTEGRSTLRLRNGFIVAEVALTLTLSVAAILLTRQLIQQSRQDLGFSAENLITLDSHAMSTDKVPDASNESSPALRAASEEAASASRLTHLDATLESIATVPGVESVSAIDGAPMGFGGADVSYAVKGRQVFAPGAGKLPDADIHSVTPGFFATMRIPLLRGRALTPEDRFDAPPVLLINQALARQIFPNQDPVGQQIMCGYDWVSTWWTIVGVVGDIRDSSPGADPHPTFYVPVAQHPDRAADVQLVVRTRTDAAVMVEALQNRLKATHPEIAIKATTMRENIGDTQRSERFRTALFGSFAAISILLAAVGMYGVTAYSVTQRRFEFGLRVALGANRAQVLGMVLRDALQVALLGIAIGVVLTLSLVRVLDSVVGKLPAFDAPAYALAAFAVLLIALFATLLPARAAASVEPMDVLRSE